MKKLLVLPVVLGVIVLGFGYANVAFAANDENPDEAIIGVSVGPDGMLSGSISMSPATYAGLESADVGTLPTSTFYFWKEWKRGITRLFTFDAIAKAQLELNITNQIAAEVLEVAKTSSTINYTGLERALQKYTDAQERLNMRIGKLSANSNPNVEKLLKEVDERTAKHVDLLEQLTVRKAGKDNQEYLHIVDEALKNTLKTFTFTVTNNGGVTSGAVSLKQKAEEQIERAGVAIDDTNGAFGQVSTTRGMVIEDVNTALGQVSTTRGMWRPSTDDDTGLPGAPVVTSRSNKRAGITIEGELDIFDRWGNSIAKAKEHLTEAKKAFADGKYGEAYGLARSAEAIASGVRVAVGDINGDGRADKAAPASSETPSKQKVNISENESPRPSDRPEASSADKSTPEKRETPEAKPTTPASDTTNSSGAGSRESTEAENKTGDGPTVESGASLQLR